MRRIVALAALVLLLAGCASPLMSTERGDVVRRILAATVQLRSEREGGGRRAASGVVVAVDPADQRAWIATARHFLDPQVPQQVSVRLPATRTMIPARVALLSEEVDLAIVEVRGLDLTPIRLKPSASLGDEILLVAFPWGRRFTVVSGIVSQITATTGATLVEGPVRMVDASVSHGSSGGGVFDAQSGELLGIVESYRTAKVSIPEVKDRVLEVPVAGETTLVSTPSIQRFLVDSGLAEFLAK